ncbi:MAG: CDP-alcohol phosphatidyltransferase family protein [Actinomycetota bacterium]|nr:CDP-alcohol phosphatidyltransferase family protein [Actinomycetota bacterium]
MISGRISKNLVEEPLAPVFKRVAVSPNVITITGFLITVAGAAVIAFNLRAGGLIILFGGLFDGLDGMVARANGKSTRFGAYLDSVLDRYSDAFIFFGVAYYLRANITGVLPAMGTLAGAFLISYARARAEGLGVQCKIGLMERPERLVFIIAGALTGYMIPVLWAMFIATHFTVVQRMVHTKKMLSERG